MNPEHPYGTATNLVAVPFGAKVLWYTWPDRTWVLEQLVVVEPPRFRFTISVPFVVLNWSPGSHVILFLYSREFVVMNKLLSGSLTASLIGPRNLHEPSFVIVRVKSLCISATLSHSKLGIKAMAWVVMVASWQA